MTALAADRRTPRREYGWLGAFPKMREWLGQRTVHRLAAHRYKIVNRNFEQTMAVKRDEIDDDTYGFYGPLFEELGKAAGELPDELVFTLLREGFTAPCYDGVNFFAVDHPVGDGVTKDIAPVSNFQGGAGEPWFLLDCSRPIKPMIFQERSPLGNLVRQDQPETPNVFWNKEYIYGSDGRCNVGFGLWQLAYASKEPLTAENYENARKAMSARVSDTGRPLGVKPDTLVCGTNLEGEAMRLLNNGTRIVVVGDADTPVPVQNEWAGTAKPIVTAWLNAA